MTDRTDRLIELAYGAGWSLTKHAPTRLSAAAFRRGADLAFDRRGPRTIQLAKNLRRVLGADATPAALAAVTKAGMRSYARYWYETFRLPAMDRDEVVSRGLSAATGMDHVAAAQNDGRGVIISLPHSGNWDIAGMMITHLFGGLVSVNERLKPDAIYQRFVDFRTSLGFEILPLTGGERPAATVIKERLREGKVICLVGDREFGTGGIPVDFFGERTTLPGGPVLLVTLTDAVILPAHLAYSDTGWITEIGAPLEIAGTRLRDQVHSGTQQIAAFFESRIAEHPADWHMLQPFWPSDMPVGDPRRGAL